MNSMDEKVLAFLKEWLAWAEAGGPEHGRFRPEYGLCANAFNYGRGLLWDYFENVIFADDSHPFGADDYRDREENQTQHECPKRLAWVRDKIAELEA